MSSARKDMMDLLVLPGIVVDGDVWEMAVRGVGDTKASYCSYGFD